jgi:hypothetical protein
LLAACVCTLPRESPERRESAVESTKALGADARPAWRESAVESTKALGADARPAWRESAVESTKALAADARPERRREYQGAGGRRTPSMEGAAARERDRSSVGWESGSRAWPRMRAMERARGEASGRAR